MGGMGLAGVDDALELGVRQEAVRSDPGGQAGPVSWQGRGGRRHGGRLHEPGGMGLRVWYGDRLKHITLVNTLSGVDARIRRRLSNFIGGFDAVGLQRRSAGENSARRLGGVLARHDRGRRCMGGRS
jgi:hypothetical protein